MPADPACPSIFSLKTSDHILIVLSILFRFFSSLNRWLYVYIQAVLMMLMM